MKYIYMYIYICIYIYIDNEIYIKVETNHMSYVVLQISR